jgi:3-oxoacyl-[acyl-carrier protein] reductase
MKLLEGKTAIITGATRGIGKAIALRFAQEGCNVAFTDLFEDENMKATEAEIAALGVKVKGYASNAAKFDETQTVVDQIVKDFGRVDVLVNNAGITKDGALKRMTEDQWDAVIAVNLKSVFNFTKAVQPVMWKQGIGSIINMSSVVGVSGNANQINYSSSKAGIIGFTKSAAKEFGTRNIRCNAIAPGFIITEMTGQLPEDVRKAWEANIPMKRGGEPDEVAKACLFLASDLSSYVSGQVINVCGAMNT